MTIEQMKERKRELGLTIEMIAEQSGIPFSTVQKIFSGATQAPRKLTIDALTRVLAGPSDQEPVQEDAPGTAPDQMQNILKDSSALYGTSPRQIHRYTIDDYYSLPDDQRAELIDGVFYDMAAPTLRHQSILLELAVLFKNCIRQHAQPCEVYIAPCDVRLDMDDYTMVQPDIFILCREHDRDARRCEGAPDLAVEILSPSTRSKDMVLKLYKYQRAGVREYWIVDPANRKVFVHCFGEENYMPRQYDFSDTIPIGISEGRCSIDFSAVD